MQLKEEKKSQKAKRTLASLPQATACSKGKREGFSEAAIFCGWRLAGLARGGKLGYGLLAASMSKSESNNERKKAKGLNLG